MLHEGLPGAPREARARPRAGSRRREPRAGTSPTTSSTRVLPFVNRELGWNDPNWLANGHSFQVLLDRYVEGAGAARARGRRGQGVGARASGSSATASTSRPTSSSTRTSASAAARSTATSVAGPGRRRAPAVRRRTFDLTYCVATLHHALDLHADGAGDGARHAAGRSRRRPERGRRAASARSADNPDQAGENELGINEHVHSVLGVRGGVRARRARDPAARALRRLAAASRIGGFALARPEDRDDARRRSCT